MITCVTVTNCYCAGAWLGGALQAAWKGQQAGGLKGSGSTPHGHMTLDDLIAQVHLKTSPYVRGQVFEITLGLDPLGLGFFWISMDLNALLVLGPLVLCHHTGTC
jgi:hypothetical protein